MERNRLVVSQHAPPLALTEIHRAASLRRGIPIPSRHGFVPQPARSTSQARTAFAARASEEIVWRTHRAKCCNQGFFNS
jgi:hypothetical protein